MKTDEMKAHQSTVGKNDEWLTPPSIVSALGRFDLDPCAPAVRPWDTAETHISLPKDGLALSWQGRVWLNPPFNRYERPKWMKKMAEHQCGTMLIPAATETEAFHEFVWNRASAVCFLLGRPHFHFVEGTRAAFNSGTAICLVSYGYNDRYALENANLGRVVLP